eukprot:scaffold187520_cov24-Tisochrysis_lutea.AAC.1
MDHSVSDFHVYEFAKVWSSLLLSPFIVQSLQQPSGVAWHHPCCSLVHLSLDSNCKPVTFANPSNEWIVAQLGFCCSETIAGLAASLSCPPSLRPHCRSGCVTKTGPTRLCTNSLTHSIFKMAYPSSQ